MNDKYKKSKPFEALPELPEQDLTAHEYHHEEVTSIPDTHNPNAYTDKVVEPTKVPKTITIKENSIPSFFGEFLVTGGTPEYYKNQAPLRANDLGDTLTLKKSSGLEDGDLLKVQAHGYTDAWRYPMTMIRTYKVSSYDDHCVRAMSWDFEMMQGHLS